MFLKIIFTGLAIFSVYLLGRYHVVRRLPTLPQPQVNPPANRPASAASRSSTLFQSRLPFVVAAIVILLTAILLYRSWQDQTKVLKIRVVNAGNGQTTFYEARKKQVHARTFQTLDGRSVTLADVERMEVIEPE
ncbi:MAG: hypothetical protein H7833_06430 [Magnetococcus sp. DMHC-1]|nr:hypothetical protein [Magnetococcales bacterium]